MEAAGWALAVVLRVVVRTWADSARPCRTFLQQTRGIVVSDRSLTCLARVLHAGIDSTATSFSSTLAVWIWSGHRGDSGITTQNPRPLLR